jgi:glutamine cyclotransferase
MDGLGMSSNTSFLAFLNSRIMSSITTLGVSLSNDVAKRIENIKELEYNKLLEASTTKPKDKEL